MSNKTYKNMRNQELLAEQCNAIFNEEISSRKNILDNQLLADRYNTKFSSIKNQLSELKEKINSAMVNIENVQNDEFAHDRVFSSQLVELVEMVESIEIHAKNIAREAGEVYDHASSQGFIV